MLPTRVGTGNSLRCGSLPCIWSCTLTMAWVSWAAKQQILGWLFFGWGDTQGVQGWNFVLFFGKVQCQTMEFLGFLFRDGLAGWIFSINQRQELEEEPLMEGILHQLKYGEYPQLKYEEYPIFHRVSLDNRWCRKPPSIDSMTQLHFANAAHHVLLSCYDARFGDATLRGTILGLSVHYYGYGPDAQLGNIGRTVADHQQEVL